MSARHTYTSRERERERNYTVESKRWFTARLQEKSDFSFRYHFL